MTTTTKSATTPRRQPDTEARCRTLPLLVTPRSGEPFDSWLLAYAHRLGTPVGELLAALGLRPDTFLAEHTIMLHADEAARAAQLTGLSAAQLDAMTLRPFHGRMVALEARAAGSDPLGLVGAWVRFTVLPAVPG